MLRALRVKPDIEFTGTAHEWLRSRYYLYFSLPFQYRDCGIFTLERTRDDIDAIGTYLRVDSCGIRRLTDA